MRRETTLTISCGRVLKAKAQTMIFTRVQSDDDDDRKIVVSSNYICNGAEDDIAQTYHITLIEDSEVEEEDTEDAPVELEEGEVNKLIEVSFIREVNYPMWISSIVLVRNKNGQIRICVDFRDLNNACPKDDFPLPIVELMIDASRGHEALSFMDGSFGYNQIRMALADEELTVFRTPKIFDDMLHKNVECYVDDLVVKSKKRENHFHDLRKVFEHLMRYQLRMNPSKCAFGVTLEKFLGFIVRQ
ncbi:hypothetical protein Sango_3016300 [Sesamum angolense]|uniref:Reverse transcriptase domain-containing protein n=1 Tax=Sesamum angolense TaxID=2727404 RepID=A0AAE1VZA6_9LAMI|nr:hypothetical protein Sango_3016300 [Sesamum angolense]